MLDYQKKNKEKINPKFGVAGFPPAFWKSEYKKDRLNGPQWLKEIDLDLLELQMTYGPKMLEKNALEFKKQSDKYGITLTIHASYFIVLTSSDDRKISRSFETLEKTCHLAELCGASRIILHPGSVYDSRINSLELFKKNISHFNKNYLPDGINIYPETAGKRGQLGTEEEILNICKEVPRCFPCFDFGHLRAFSGEGYTHKEDMIHIFKETEKVLGKKSLLNTHVHVSPIEFGKGGERRHRTYGEMIVDGNQGDLFGSKKGHQYYYPLPEHVAEAIFELKLPLLVVSECHDSQEAGAIAMKKKYFSL